jgi:PDZ domain-containing protein
MQNDEWSLNDPPGVHPVKGVHPWRYVIASVILILLLLAAFLVPLSMYYVYLPGPARDVESLVDVTGAKTYSSEGSLFLTTVTVDTEVTFVDLVQAGLDSQKAVVEASTLTQGGSLKDLEDQQEREMDGSKMSAQEVALSALGIASPTGDGARIVETIEGSPAAGVLQKQDTIVELNHVDVGTTCDVDRLMNSVEPGEAVSLVILRDGKRKTIPDLKTVSNPQDGSALIGISMTDVNLKFDPDIDVKFRTGAIGGPSAGLMFSLGLYDRLTPEDLTGGKQIAGTGTIQCGGSVGPIGGIEEKIAGAERAGAELFLAPEGDAEAAKKVAHDLTVVSISSFEDAVEYLESHS